MAGVASGCCGSGLGTGTGLAGAPSADSGSPLATGTQDERSRRGFSDFSRLLRAVLLPADAVQFFDWMAMAGEARRRGWLDWRRQICKQYWPEQVAYYTSHGRLLEVLGARGRVSASAYNIALASKVPVKLSSVSPSSL